MTNDNSEEKKKQNTKNENRDITNRELRIKKKWKKKFTS